MRVLVVLSDTDRTDASLCALDLHAGLAALGDEVRTVALGPGRRGGLDHVVPVLAPSSRSLSAVLQLRREQRWADVALCFGVAAAEVQRRASWRRNVPSVVVLVEGVADGSGTGRSARRTLDRAASVVCTDEVTSAAPGILSARSVTNLDFGVAAEDVHDLAARRAAARAELGLAASEPVLWWVGAPGTDVPAALTESARRRGWSLLGTEEADDELVVAASDVAVLGPAALTGPPRELMRAAASGHAVVAPAHVAGGHLVGPDTGVPLGVRHGSEPDSNPAPDWDAALDVVTEPDRRAQMARAARLVMDQRYSPLQTLPAWRSVLDSACREG